MDKNTDDDSTSPWTSQLLACTNVVKFADQALRSGIAIYACHHDGKQVYYSRLSIDVDSDKLLLHVLTKMPPPDIPHQIIQWSALRQRLQYDNVKTFFTIRPQVGATFRVYIKLHGDNPLCRQFLWFNTGEKDGASYHDVKFQSHVSKGTSGEEIIIGPYDGERAVPLIQGYNPIDKVDNPHKYKGYDSTIRANNTHLQCEGLVTVSHYDEEYDSRKGTFVIQMTPGYEGTSWQHNASLGVVSEGMANLKLAATASTSIDQLSVEDCGVVLPVV